VSAARHVNRPAVEDRMGKRLDPITRLNKDITERLLGHQPGRPTFSRRTGRLMASATGIHEDACVDIFHIGLAVVALRWAAKSLASEKPSVSPRSPPVWP
jgi:hypothetical protein